ncbi:MAG: alpha/beta fold hydrolase [Bacteroidales bacterium]|nr:alpha/beta fold hydrolase [Bacteroidales bacterium]MCI2134250.1 alpha/beta fold hydrolase [Bacteroidales bacterium]
MTKKTFLIMAAAFLAISAPAQENNGTPSSKKPVVIERQGNFSVGGSVIQRPGAYDNSKFVGWAQQVETGQSARVDHAFVDYQIPAGAKSLPLVFIHGYGGSGVCWEMTPDGRDGFSTLMLRHGYPTYVMDLPGRGRAGRTSATAEVKPLADEMFWFDIWRIGIWPNYNDGVQFPADSAYLSQFFREMTPDLSDHKQDVPAINALADKLGKAILVTHSAGGFPGWLAAMQRPSEIKAIAAYEPGGFVFPEGEVPEKIDGLTGGCAGVGVPAKDFEALCNIPIVLYFGDYIPETPSKNLGDENWRVRLQMARKFVECINRHGGHATLVELPKVGIHGNTHFLMQDLNNDILADMLAQWLADNKLDASAEQPKAEAKSQQLPAFTLFPARTFSKEEQSLIDLSDAKWKWMSEKDTVNLRKLFNDQAMFVHMGGSWGKEAELRTIGSGSIWYKHAEIHSRDVKIADKTAIVYSHIHLTSEVGGREVTFPFTSSEVYVRHGRDWQLLALIFTRMLGD